MRKIKLLTNIAVAILVAGALASVAAQKPVPGPVVGPLNGTYTMAVSANELSPGDTEYALAETYGWTCYGKTGGDLTGFMFMSMNYAMPEYLAVGIQSSITPPVPIQPASRITGGSWTKLIFNRGVYVGSVYGKISGGTITWSKTDLSSQMSIELTADDGTGSFAGNTGKGTFAGTIEHSLKSDVVSVTGVLTLKY